MTISGMDGSGKTTIAHQVVRALKDRGIPAEYFYGHRPSYHKDRRQISFSIFFKGVWRRIGRTPEEFDGHRGVKTIFDFMTLLDYLVILGRLSRALRRNAIVIVDRYAADVVAYLRFLGGESRPIENILLRVSFEPDIAVFFDVSPQKALERKQEQTLAELERFEGIYARLRDRIRFEVVDANAPMDTVRGQLATVLETRLRFDAGRLASETAGDATPDPSQSDERRSGNGWR